jgi:hypothetical protein
MQRHDAMGSGSQSYHDCHVRPVSFARKFLVLSTSARFLLQAAEAEIYFLQATTVFHFLHKTKVYNPLTSPVIPSSSHPSSHILIHSIVLIDLHIHPHL